MSTEMPAIHHLYNRSFFGNRPAPDLNVPGYVQTTQPQDLPRAQCVIVHLPSILLTHRQQEISNLRKVMPAEQVWVAQFLESVTNYPAIADLDFMAQFDIEMSHRQCADIWTPYIPPKIEQALANTKISRRKKRCCAFVSSKVDESSRQTYMRELMQKLDVHSYGKFMRNKRFFIDRGVTTKLRILEKYTFTLAFENSIEPDYVTEKFYQPLLTGSIPIYLGAPNIEDFAPGENCYVNTDAFPSPASLASYVREVDASSFHHWRKQPLRAEFLNRIERLATPRLVALGKLLDQRIKRV